MKTTGVGKLIKSLREANNLSQKELGEIFGFAGRTVSDWEREMTEPNISTIKALVEFFGITYDEFFEEVKK